MLYGDEYGWSDIGVSLWKIFNELSPTMDNSETIWFASKKLVRIVPEIRTAYIKFSRYTAKGITVDAKADSHQAVIDKFNSHLGESIGTHNTLEQYASKIARQLYLYGMVIVQKVYGKSPDGKKTAIIDLLVRDALAYQVTRDTSGKITNIRGKKEDGLTDDLPLNDYIILYIDDDFDGDGYPSTAIGSIIDIVALYRSIIDNYDLSLERFASPHLHVSLPEWTSKDMYNEVKSEVEDMTADSSFVTMGGDIEVLSSDINSTNVVAILDHLQKRIVSGLMLPSFMIGVTEGSNRSMGKEQRRDMKNMMSPYREIISYTLKVAYSELLGIMINKLNMNIIFDDSDLDDTKTETESFALMSQAMSVFKSMGYSAEFDEEPTLVFPDGTPFRLVKDEDETPPENNNHMVGGGNAPDAQRSKDKATMKGVDNRVASND